MSIAIAASLTLAIATITVEAPLPEVQPVAGYEELSQNRNEAAVERLTARHDADDPAQLINLGTAYVRLGRTAEAQRVFAQAVHSEGRTDLLLADGQEMDSRTAARTALHNLRAQPVGRALIVGNLFRR